MFICFILCLLKMKICTLWILIFIMYRKAWSQVWHTFAESEYYFSHTYDSVSSWENSQTLCERQNATLVIISSVDKQSFLETKTYKDYGYWIGLVRGQFACSCHFPFSNECKQCRQSWVWRGSDESISYQNWLLYYPSSADNCARLFRGRSWRTDNCDSAHLFICERGLCTQYPCKMGNCTAFNGQASCQCFSGYTGPQCDTDIDDCQGIVCQNNGSCIDALNSYSCSCKDGYSGENCETKFNQPTSEDGAEIDGLVIVFILSAILATLTATALAVMIGVYIKCDLYRPETEGEDISTNDPRYIRLCTPACSLIWRELQK